MILKNYETNKIDLQKYKYFLLYGNNKGHIKEIIEKNFINKFSKNIYNYDEKEILKDKTIFFEKILNNSFFEKEKLILLSNITDKSKSLIEEIKEGKNDDLIFILIADQLDKKSKIRKFFEENEDSICMAFYPDTTVTLNKIAIEFLKEKKILMSQLNINLIIGKCNNDRQNLINELKKIELFSMSNKKISKEDLLKIINLAENHSIFDLIDSCLLKDQKKVINIINENNFNIEDAIIILRTFLIKLKKILKLSDDFEKNSNINQTIANAKPPIFWKEKDTIKQEILNWRTDKIRKLILKINEIELQIKKNNYNPINLVLDFIFEQSSKKN